MDSFRHPVTSTNVNYIGVLNLLEALRSLKLNSRLFQPSSSEMYGHQDKSLVSEETKFNPSSPYAIAKYAAHRAIQIYRDHYNVQAISAILFNHESELRGREFVTRKITQAACKISKGLQDALYLGNLDAKRDWGYAPEYCEGMWRILQQKEPQDFVLATGKSSTVRKFVELTFEELDIEIIWEGYGIDEVGRNKKTNKIIIKIDKDYYRPTEIHQLKGDSSKAARELNWAPKTNLEQLVKLMVESDMKKLKEEQGYRYKK